MKTIRLAGIILLAFLTIGFASCNKDNNGNNTNDEIIEYQGEYPVPENIEYVEDGVTYEIEAIPGQVVISTDEDYNTVINAVNAHEGKIIEQYPQYGLYTVEVIVGKENAFVAALNDLNISAELNLVEYPKERYDYFVFDDYADANGIHHGRNVSNILSECQNDAVINEVNNVIKFIIPLNYTNFLLWNKLLSQDMVLVNWSHGYGNGDWQNMAESERNNFKEGWKKEVIRKIEEIIRLKKKNPNIDIVFAHAAGNERCPEISQMINDLKSNPKYKRVLDENMIFVSDYSLYANTSSQYGDFCYIKEHPYFYQNGGSTSYATPQALCYINQVIKGTIGEDGKNITAVQALAAVKAAIRQNSNGDFDLDEALEMARIMYSPGFFTGTPFDNTSWNVPISYEITETGILRVRVTHYGPNGVYYTYRNEDFSETESRYDLLTPSFINNTYYDDRADFEFKGDSIILIMVSPEGEIYTESYVNDEASVFEGPNYIETMTYSGYFINSNSFCLKQVKNLTARESWSENNWYKYHDEIEITISFTINESTNVCSIDYDYTENLNAIEYGSEFYGPLSEQITMTGHGVGTYEHGVKDIVGKQRNDLDDLMFIHGIPAKRHK